MGQTLPDAGRSPFARFPWVQLAFCLACLSVAAWTWMRYSYAWDVTPEGICSWSRASLDGRYVVLAGRPSNWDSESCDYLFDVPAGNGGRERIVARVGLQARPSSLEDPVTVAGRVTIGLTVPETLGPVVHIHAYWGRWHPASVAGLVVEAMGCFIFGLYLRSWVKERETGRMPRRVSSPCPARVRIQRALPATQSASAAAHVSGAEPAMVLRERCPKAPIPKSTPNRRKFT